MCHASRCWGDVREKERLSRRLPAIADTPRHLPHKALISFSVQGYVIQDNIFRDNAPTTPTSGGMQIDRKRFQKLREKIIALGHKPDDHEEEQNMGGMTMGGW